MRVVTNPAERQFHGYAGDAPIYASPTGDLLVDRFLDDEPGHVRVCASVGSSVSVRLTTAEAKTMATAVLAQLVQPGGISPVDLSLLIHRNRPVEIEPCRVCGAELGISSMGGGKGTKYVCSSAAAKTIGKTGEFWAEASEHSRRSEVQIGYHGDDGLVAALTELRRLRTLLGEDMAVPVGAKHFPYGHGRHRCVAFLVHRGGDVWEQEYDSEFTHDPTHRNLTPEETTDDDRA